MNSVRLTSFLAYPRFIRPWYLAYLLLGITTAGMIPILLPLMIEAYSHRLMAVALVTGAYELGLLTSPVWGIAAERYNLYRALFFTGFATAAFATALMPVLHILSGWLFLAFAIGAGTGGAATLASLFVVDFSPREEWELRIGFLQSFNGTGQVIGLLLAAAFSRGSFGHGLAFAGALLVPALVVGRAGLPKARTDPNLSTARIRLPQTLDVRAMAALPRLDTTSGVILHFNPLNVCGLQRLSEVVGTMFGRFLLSWFMFAMGISAFLAYLPLLLADRYGIDSHMTAVIYATAAAVGIGLFVISGQWATRIGTARVYRAGLSLRVAGFVVLLLPELFPCGHRMAFGIVGFVPIVLGWPIISVSGTNLAARLAPFSEGSAMGLLNASLALAAVVGVFASGPLVRWFGYDAILALGLGSLLSALLLSAKLGKAR